MDTRRLFLFAAYDAQGIVGPALAFYVKSLAFHGDVVVVTDNDLPENEIRKLHPYVRHIVAERHNEYDFGSYKRAYLWSREHLDLDSYEFCYLVNDSVYGPLREPGPLLMKMEDIGTDAFGLVINPHRRDPHIQSWFVGLGREVFLSDWFGGFMEGITRQEDMNMIYSLYEIGLTRLIEAHGLRYDALFRFKGKAIYNSVKHIYIHGLPFIKKSAFTRHNASLGAEIKFVLDDCAERGPSYSKEASEAVLNDCMEVYGGSYMDHLLQSSRIEMLRRHIIYLFKKIFS